MSDSLRAALTEATEALLCMNPGAIVRTAEHLEAEAMPSRAIPHLEAQISAARNAATCARALLEPLLQSLRAAGGAYTASGEPAQDIEGRTRWVTF